jgi:hypothetical protein
VHERDKKCIQIFVGIPQDLGVKWVINNINKDPRKIEYEGTKWIQLVQNRSSGWLL